MILGRFAVRLWISWIDGKGLTASLWGVAGDERIGIREWVQTSLTTQYPKQRFADLRSSEFCFLREDPSPPMFPLELEPERIQRYLIFISDNLKLIIPKLVEFYRAKLPIVNAIRQYTQNMVDAIAKEFPSNEGWRIDRTDLINLRIYACVTIRHVNWAKNLALELQSMQPWNAWLDVSLSRPMWKKYGDYEPYIFQLCQENMVFKRRVQRDDQWSIFRQSLPAPNGNTCEPSFASPDCRFVYDTTEKQQEMIALVIKGLAWFKKIQPELDKLAMAME